MTALSAPSRRKFALRSAVLASTATLGLALGGCAPTLPQGPSPDLFGEWVLVSGSSGPRALTFDQSATFTLDIGADSSGGSTPCNTYTVDINGGEGADSGVANEPGQGPISMKATRTTKEACANSDLQELEQRYIAILSDATEATVDVNDLVLVGGGSQLLFEQVTAVE